MKDKPLNLVGTKILKESQVEKTALEVASSMLEAQKKVEPLITAGMKSVAGVTGGRLAGLEFRVKSLSSLVRKIETDAKYKDLSFEESAVRIVDVLRYTTIFSVDNFGPKFLEMKARLESLGFITFEVKNTWKDEEAPYRGVNTKISYKGLMFEMQYHTEESFDLKNGQLHNLYEEARDLSTPRERRQELVKEMIALSASLESPQGIDQVQ